MMRVQIEKRKAVAQPQKLNPPRRIQLLKNLTFYLPLLILTLLVFTAIFADLLAPHDPVAVSMPDRLLPPAFMKGGTPKYLLGTDQLGRDILSRMIYGSRISLSVSLAVIAITASIGTVMGIVAGYLGGATEALLMRITDISMAFPPMLLALLLAVVFGPGFWTVVLALSILGWAPYARLIRGETLKLRNADFVAQARINGASSLRIMVKHIFPNIVNSLIVVITMAVGMLILAEAALSFLGVGVPPPAPSWGYMVNEGRSVIDRAWWISTFPGIVIGLVVLSGNFLGDWIRDKLDPRLRQL
ncbi:MAG: ABC transporter permease [Firmicutes bacterium]|jgi:peptide/nickel transport system permease protein|nr:ABC transporter permease [Bacillota bacterium]